ncbi:hypothetical protein CSA37_03330 [Candidatus Fermentibacteria bacterium]|nr:MAG: hypothetical protein CSA37_03330 [Candidatus Fermentibacteria bacterium]
MSPVGSIQLEQQDLTDGFKFYESREVRLGSYFLDSLIADIDSRQLYSGINPVVLGYHRMLAQCFPYAKSSPLPGKHQKAKSQNAGTMFPVCNLLRCKPVNYQSMSSA